MLMIDLRNEICVNVSDISSCLPIKCYTILNRRLTIVNGIIKIKHISAHLNKTKTKTIKQGRCQMLIGLAQARL